MSGVSVRPHVAMMTREKARACVTAINEHHAAERRLVLDLHEQEGWRALGYASWRECVVAEFEQSQARLYQLLTAALVDRELSTIVESPVRESHARELAPLLGKPEVLREVYEEVREGQGDKATAADFQEAVKARLETERPGEQIALSPAAPPPVLPEPEVFTPEPPRLAVHFSSDNDEWYTPSHILERVGWALGAIELDPCAEPERQVPAARHYTQAEDGLAQPWEGRVFMNPPYSTIGRWVERLALEYTQRRVSAAIALVPARVDTGWWALLSEHPVCFVRGRLRFSNAENSAPFPSALVYLGDDLAAFVRAFHDLGAIYQRVRLP